jgi:hypothetical protein
MPHKYDAIIENFAKIFDEMAKLELSDVLSKGGVGEILLAHHLNHELVPSDKGADGLDDDQNKYEYKVSVTDQFNFHFGTRNSKSDESPCEKVKKHFVDLKGSFCALRKGAKIEKLIFLPVEDLVNELCDHFSKTDGQQLNKNFTFEKLKTVSNAKIIKDVI